MSESTSTSTTAVATVIPDAAVGQKCTFLTVNPNDQITWSGTIEGVVSYNVARGYTDLVSYNAAARQAQPNIPADLTLHQFVLITLENAQGVSTTEAFSTYWMTPGSFAIVTQNVQISITVFDSPTADHSIILQVLRAAGFKCYIQSVSS